MDKKEKRLPDGWRTLKIGDIAEVVGGGTPRTNIPEYWKGDIPWLTPKDLSNLSGCYISKGVRYLSKLGLLKSNAKLLPRGTVLLTTRAPVGYLAIADREVSTNQGFRSLVADEEKAHNLFLFYLLRKNVEYLKSKSEGTTFGELTGSTLKSLSFAFPPLKEQKTIAEVLSSFDDKIDLFHRQNKTLEGMAQTLFRKYFIEDAMRLGGGGQRSWKNIRLSDVYNFQKGFEPGSQFYENKKTKNNIRFIRVGDMLNKCGQTYIDINRAKSNCKISDLLISFDGTVGRLAFGISGGYSSGIRKVSSDDKTYNNLGFKYLLFSTTAVKETIHKYARGTVILHAGNAIEFLSFRLPPKPIIQTFNKLIDPLFDKMLVNQSQIHILKTLRNTLLPKLMSGKITVSQETGY